jgi:hypothetical protein
MKRNSIQRKAKLVYNLKNFIITLPFHFLVMGSVFVIAFIFGKWFEAVSFLVAFFSLRYKFDTTYHSKSIVICMTCAISMFSLSIAICPPVYMYVLASIGFAYLDCWLLWFIQDRLEKKQDLEVLSNLNLELERKLLNNNKDELEELTERCRKADLSKRDTEIAIMYFYNKHTPKEIWLYICENKEYESIEWDSVYKLLWRIGRKINK